MDTKVYFAGVVRVTNGPAVVICCHATTNMFSMEDLKSKFPAHFVPGQSSHVAVAQLAWHLLQDDGVVYVVVTVQSYPERCANEFLRDLRTQFQSKADLTRVSTSKENAMNGALGAILKEQCRKYNDLESLDKLTAVQAKVEAAKETMADNIRIAINNTASLERIEEKSEELSVQAGLFQKQSSELKNKMWWKNMKMYFIIGFLVVCVLGLVVGLGAGLATQKTKR